MNTTIGPMSLTCKHGLERATGRNHPEATCDKAAVLLVLHEEEVWHAGDVREDLIIAWPSCADHASEDVHETSTSMSAGEYAVVPIPAMRVAAPATTPPWSDDCRYDFLPADNEQRGGRS